MLNQLSPHTIRELDRLIDYTLAEPRRINMEDWGIAFDPDDSKGVRHALDHISESFGPNSPMLDTFSRQDLPPCGMAGCLAGGTVMLNAGLDFIKQHIHRGSVNVIDLVVALAPTLGIDPDMEINDLVLTVGAKYLGITRKQSMRLFCFQSMYHVHDGRNYWPPELSEAYLETSDLTERAEIVAKRLRLFKTTQGRK